MRTRILIGATGVFGIGYGVFRLLENQQVSQPPHLLRWLIAAVVLHDGVLAPLTLLVGAVLTRLVRPRARRYVQGALLTGGVVAVVSWPLIHREGGQPASKVLLAQDYSRNLTILLVIVAAGAALAYAVRVVRDSASQRASDTNVRPPAVHTSDSA